MTREIQYFGQSKTIQPNPYINYPVNNPIAAAEFGNFVRQQIPSSQVEYGKRRMMKWLVPERGIIEMYVNPQSIRISQRKKITSERSKGGFIIQYWGEELIDISISGNTGSSGIEGINVLNDIYRGEQLAFDIIALEEMAKAKDEDEQFLTSLFPGLGQITEFLSDMGEQFQGTGLTIPRPTLGFYASTVELYYMGEVYRGYFENFEVNEAANQLGLFEYTMMFKATQKRGVRRNYMPWHHSAVAGPSDHDSVPFTYGSIIFPSRLDDSERADMANNAASGL